MGARKLRGDVARARQDRRTADGGWFRDLRLAAGLTQAAVAERLGVTKAAVSQWEKGAVGLPDDARNLADALANPSNPNNRPGQ